MDSDLVKLQQDTKARILEQTALGVRIGLEALSVRAITILALLLNVGVFAWAIYNPMWERLIAASVFALFSYCVIHVRPKGNDNA